MPATWLITGAQGFLGRYVASYILCSDPEASVIGLGRSPALPSHFSHAVSGPHGKVRAYLPDAIILRGDDRYQYCRADVTSRDRMLSVLEEFRPAKIIHLASGLRGDAPDDLLRVNVGGTEALLYAVERAGDFSPTFVLGSSGGTYGIPVSLPLSETDCCEPIDDYSKTKLAAEVLTRSSALQQGFRLIIGRIFNIIGAGQDERHIAGQIASQLSRSCFSGERVLRFGPLDTTRDFIDVRDAARILVTLARDEGAAGAYNIGSGVESPVSELLRIFLESAGADLTIESHAEKSAGVTRHYADITRLLEQGVKPQYSLRHSVDSVWTYYQRLWLN